MRTRRDGHISRMLLPSNVNRIKLLQEIFPIFPSLPTNLAPDSGASGSHTRAVAANANQLIPV